VNEQEKTRHEAGWKGLKARDPCGSAQIAAYSRRVNRPLVHVPDWRDLLPHFVDCLEFLRGDARAGKTLLLHPSTAARSVEAFQSSALVGFLERVQLAERCQS
jgi:hypothetical protein